jgi:hypothetical protein
VAENDTAKAVAGKAPPRKARAAAKKRTPRKPRAAPAAASATRSTPAVRTLVRHELERLRARLQKKFH